MENKGIHERLKRNNINYTVIAEAVGVTPSHVRNVALGIFTSHRVAKAIAVALGVPLLEVFPEYEGKEPRGKKRERRKKAVADLKKKIDKTV